MAGPDTPAKSTRFAKECATCGCSDSPQAAIGVLGSYEDSRSAAPAMAGRGGFHGGGFHGRFGFRGGFRGPCCFGPGVAFGFGFGAPAWGWPYYAPAYCPTPVYHDRPDYYSPPSPGYRPPPPGYPPQDYPPHSYTQGYALHPSAMCPQPQACRLKLIHSRHA